MSQPFREAARMSGQRAINSAVRPRKNALTSGSDSKTIIELIHSLEPRSLIALHALTQPAFVTLCSLGRFSRSKKLISRANSKNSGIVLRRQRLGSLVRDISRKSRMKSSAILLPVFASALASATTAFLTPAAPTSTAQPVTEDALVAEFQRRNQLITGTIPPALQHLLEALDIGDKWVKFAKTNKDLKGPPDVNYTRFIHHLSNDVERLWEISRSLNPEWFPEQPEDKPFETELHQLTVEVDDATKRGYARAVEAAETLKNSYEHAREQLEKTAEQVQRTCESFSDLDSGSTASVREYIRHGHRKGCETVVWPLARALVDSLGLRLLPARAEILANAEGKNGIAGPPVHFTNHEWENWYGGKINQVNQMGAIRAVEVLRFACAKDRPHRTPITNKVVRQAIQHYFAEASLQFFDTVLGSGFVLESYANKDDKTSSILIFGKNTTLLTLMENYYSRTLWKGERDDWRVNSTFAIRAIEKIYNSVSLGSRGKDYVVSNLIALTYHAYQLDRVPWNQVEQPFARKFKFLPAEQRAKILNRVQVFWKNIKGTLSGKKVAAKWAGKYRKSEATATSTDGAVAPDVAHPAGG